VDEAPEPGLDVAARSRAAPRSFAPKRRFVCVEVDDDGFIKVGPRGTPLKVYEDIAQPAILARIKPAVHVVSRTPLPKFLPVRTRGVKFGADPYAAPGHPARRYHHVSDVRGTQTLAGYLPKVSDVAAGPVGPVDDGVRFRGATRPIPGASHRAALTLTDKFVKIADPSLPVVADRTLTPTFARKPDPTLKLVSDLPFAAPSFSYNDLGLKVTDPKMLTRKFKVSVIFQRKNAVGDWVNTDKHVQARVLPIDSLSALHAHAVDDFSRFPALGLTYLNTVLVVPDEERSGLVTVPRACGWLVSSFVNGSSVCYIRPAPTKDLTRYGIEPNPGPLPFGLALQALALSFFAVGLSSFVSSLRSAAYHVARASHVAYAYLSAFQQVVRVRLGGVDPHATWTGYVLTFEDRVNFILSPPKPIMAYPAVRGFLVIVFVGLVGSLLWEHYGSTARFVRFLASRGRSARDNLVSTFRRYTTSTRESISAALHDAASTGSPTTTSSPRWLWWRLFFGGETHYAWAKLEHASSYVDGVLAVREGTHVSFHGRDRYPGQISQRVSALEMHPTATVRFWCFARHSRETAISRGRPGPFGVVRVSSFAPGPWHKCTDGVCVDHPAVFSLPFFDVRRFGTVLVTESGPLTHFSWDNYTGAVSVPTSLVYDAVNRWQLSGKPTQYFSIASVLKDHPSSISIVMNAVSNGFRCAAASSPNTSIELLDTFADTQFEDASQSIAAVHNPLVSDATFVHGGGIDSLTDAVSRRVHAPPSRIAVSGHHAGLMQEFVDRFFPDSIAPVPLDEVLLRMNKPSQVREQEGLASIWDIVSSRWTAFVKTEPTKPDKPARVIIASKGPQNYAFAAYIMAMFDVMAKHTCWCPGKTGAELQELVVQLHVACAEEGVDVTDRDYSAFDATTGAYGSGLLYLALARCFPSDSGWRPLLDATISAKAGNMVGIAERIHMGIGTYSGSSDTTFRNTLLNLFVLYANAREQGSGPEGAFRHVTRRSLVSGDDSLAARTTKDLNATASSMGMVLTGRDYSSGPTTFLGRYYPDPYASSSNIADVARWLRSMHLVTKVQGFDLETSMSQKAFGRLITDPNTPLLSAYCRAVLREHNALACDPRFFDKWTYDALTAGNNYTCTDFTMDELSTYVINELGIDPAVFESLEKTFAQSAPRPGLEFPVLSLVSFKPRPGQFVGGVPVPGVSAPPPRPSLAGEPAHNEAEKAAVVATRAALSSSSPPATPVSLSSSAAGVGSFDEPAPVSRPPPPRHTYSREEASALRRLIRGLGVPLGHNPDRCRDCKRIYPAICVYFDPSDQPGMLSCARCGEWVESYVVCRCFTDHPTNAALPPRRMRVNHYDVEVGLMEPSVAPPAADGLDELLAGGQPVDDRPTRKQRRSANRAAKIARGGDPGPKARGRQALAAAGFSGRHALGGRWVASPGKGASRAPAGDESDGW